MIEEVAPVWMKGSCFASKVDVGKRVQQGSRLVATFVSKVSFLTTVTATLLASGGCAETLVTLWPHPEHVALPFAPHSGTKERQMIFKII